MPQPRKLIVILIDGLSADYVAVHGHRLPCLSALAAAGTQVRMRSAMPATSMPGRATMLTGVAPAVHGVIGNHVFDGGSDRGAFRCALPHDVAVETLAGAALRAGKDVACLGFAMVRPEDTSVFRPPWWLRGFMDGSRFAKIPTDLASGYAEQTRDPAGRLPARVAPLPAGPGAPHLAGFIGDLDMIAAAVHLASAAQPPDLILAEIAVTDTVQHAAGYATPEGHWVLAYADMLVGRLLHALERDGRLASHAVAIASDHGHAPIATAIHPDVVLPGTTWESEGATLHVVIESERHLADATARLAALGVARHASDHMPPPLRARLATFSAPPGHSFEAAPAAGPRAATGMPRYISSHGLRPGDPADDRFCAFFGNGVPRARVAMAEAEQFAATGAALLGLELAACRAAPLIAT